MNRFILFLMFMAALSGIWSIYWFTKAYLTESTRTEGWCATVSPPIVPPLTDSLLTRGETLYKNNCSACHMLNRRLIGPAMAGISKKYMNDKEWLYEWIRDSQGMIERGDTRAKELFLEYNEVTMVAFPRLMDEDIEAILDFVDYQMQYDY